MRRKFGSMKAARHVPARDQYLPKLYGIAKWKRPKAKRNGTRSIDSCPHPTRGADGQPVSTARQLIFYQLQVRQNNLETVWGWDCPTRGR
jgi:hypothetical protein